MGIQPATEVGGHRFPSHPGFHGGWEVGTAEALRMMKSYVCTVCTEKSRRPQLSSGRGLINSTITKSSWIFFDNFFLVSRTIIMPAPTALRQPVDTPEIQATPTMGMLERENKKRL